jgi:hypothetical protein
MILRRFYAIFRKCYSAKVEQFCLLILIGLSIAVFSSCKKCTSCEIKDSAGNTIQTATKTCGNATEIKTAKDNASAKSLLIGGSYQCSDE